MFSVRYCYYPIEYLYTFCKYFFEKYIHANNMKNLYIYYLKFNTIILYTINIVLTKNLRLY